MVRGTRAVVNLMPSLQQTEIFITFCLEYNEHISFGPKFYYNVSDTARYGGNNTLDPLSRGAAWLYLHLTAGDLAGYDHSAAQADLFQKAIWYLEDESAGENNSYVTAAANANGGLDEAKKDNNGLYGVGVMNLWLTRTEREQVRIS